MKFLFLLLLFFLNACSSSGHQNNLVDVINQGGFVAKNITAAPFLFTSLERMNTKSSIANIYIEGDGRAWLSKRRPSRDPTPKNPIALKLASVDPAENVIYLARPCQYTKAIDGAQCNQKYWTSHRFSPEVIRTMSAALDDIKQRHNITNFNLIGFSGGGNVAALLAVKRHDVLSVRTVAGNLDHALQTKIHNVSSMPHSLNAKDISSQISHIPQIHFVGGHDKIVPAEIAKSYKAASQSDCVKIQVIEGADHTKGWKSVWKSLLRQSLDCE